jgi:hypothetical protein
MACTSHILDQVKTLGFQQATNASISLEIDDLLIIPSTNTPIRLPKMDPFLIFWEDSIKNIKKVPPLDTLNLHNLLGNLQ